MKLAQVFEVIHSNGAHEADEQPPDKFYCRKCKKFTQNTKQERSRVFMSGAEPWNGDVIWHRCWRCGLGCTLVAVNEITE